MRAVVRFGRALVALSLVAALMPSVSPVAAARPGSAAQATTCTPDAEPNDTEEQVEALSAPACIDGTLPAGDQDLFLWTVDDAQVAQRWTISLEGVLDTVTDLKVLAISSDPGVTPVVAGSQLLQVESSLDSGFGEADDVLFPPGRYLVGISRSGTAAGGEPLTFDYHAKIAAGTPTPPARDDEPNDDARHATPVSGAFEASGDLQGSDDDLAWTLSSDDASQRWHLVIQTGITTDGQLELEQPSGDEIARVYVGPDGIGELRDLALKPGRYVLDIGQQSDGPETWIVSASPETGPLADAEPDDDASTAIALDPANLVATGRLGDAGDVDDYRLHVDDHLATLLLDVKLLWQDGPSRQLCLFDSTDTQLLCRTGDSGVALANLFLPVGDYRLEIRGDPDPSSYYVLRVDQTSNPATDFETEPNDLPTTASPWTAGVVMRGRQMPGDVDYFRLTVSGAPQLWELQATGDQISDVQWYRQDQTDLADAQVAADQHSAELDDMYLIPGDHWIRVDAVGDYSLSITPEGPPDPNGEREPNNDSLDAQPLALGVARSGRLPSDNDIDVSRFSLSAAERLHLSITPPADGAVTWRIYQDGTTEMAGTRTADVGVPISEDLSLPAGDYELWLEPGTSSKGRYSVELDREDPFEPSAALAAAVTVTAQTDQVAAYWQAGQHVDGQVTIANTGSTPETLDLDAVTSHYAWSASLGQGQVQVAAGATVSVPMSVDIQPDAWAGDPVRISVRARDATGAQAIGHVEVTPGAVVAPVNPRQLWSVPTALLGGLDVAATALGAQAVPTYDPDEEAQLYDGLTPAGAGFETGIPSLPVTLTTDLAGDDPVPVVGMILNPQAAGADISYAPKDVELWLSDDGSNWTEATSGQLSPLPIDQSFVLPSAQTARYAQLRITSMWVDGASTVALGEFKVIASPGTAPSTAPLNVADPALGGHFVSMDPGSPIEDVPYSALDEDPTANWIDVKAGVKPVWVLGFQDDRAAQLTGLEWVDPAGSDPTARDNSVQIATSVDSPFGPWTDQGTWQLKRAADGSVQPFAFGAPTWARYVRFTGDAKKADGSRELPGTLRAIEAPTSSTYHSVFAEYGSTQAGDYEIQDPPAVDAPSYAPDGNDTPETASLLDVDQTASGTAHTGDDVDWYDVSVPDGQNTLTFTLHGSPSVGVSLTLQDPTGGSIPMRYEPGADPGSVQYSATVTPGQHYHVEVQQPPFSTVFTYDTSGSMGNYLGFVYDAVRSFAGDVTPGRQAVQIVPFEEDPLLPEWSDDQYALQDAMEGVVNGGGSSSAETALLNAMQLLAPREGAKAVLIVTDAETSSFDQATAMWQQFDQLRPQVFSVQVGADDSLQRSGHYMQDWAASSNGFYQYTHTHADMDRAFERMATWLERPTEYQLTYATKFIAPPPPDNRPGTLAVVGANQGDPSKVPVASNVAVELILDTSGSMLDRLEGKRRIDIAESVLTHLVEDKLPAGVPLALRVFGDTPSSCDTRLAVPLGPLDPQGVVAQINGLHVLSSVNTPIGAALKQVASDLASVTGPRIVVLMTDGEENCGGNPAAAVRALAKGGIDVHVNIVGFQIGQKSLRSQMAGWAKLGHGTFFNATSGSDLNAALAQAVSAPFQVQDKDGKVVATGTVNGSPISLKPGTYHVVVLTDPQIEFDAVVVEAGKPLSLSLPTSP
jgi:von Willebrand factor type A domain